MATIGDIVTWVGSRKLQRTDINTDILDFALEVYNVLCANVPFPNLEVRSAEIPLIQNQDYVDISSLTDICGIMTVVLYNNGQKVQRLRQTNSRVLDAVRRTSNTQPYRYARQAQVLQLDPRPGLSTYGIVIRYWKYPTIASPTAENTVVVYPPEWLELHKWETLYRTYMFLENYDKAQALVMPSMLPRYPSPKKLKTHEIGIIPRLWNDLLLNMTQRENYDSDYNINPLRMRYTAQ